MCIRDSLWVKVVGRRTPRGQYHRRRACHAPTCGRASCRRPGGATRPCDKLVYLQATFGGLISYGLSARLLGELLPLGRTARDQGAPPHLPGRPAPRALEARNARTSFRESTSSTLRPPTPTVGGPVNTWNTRPSRTGCRSRFPRAEALGPPLPFNAKIERSWTRA